MRNVSIGKYDISAMTLGTVQLGIPYGIANKGGKPDTEQSFKVLEEAVAQGVTSFDTALLYGDSELVLGEFFASDRNKLKTPILTTKFKLGEIAGSVDEQIRSYLAESFVRLRINSLPFYMLHNPADMMEQGMPVAKTMEALKAEGKIDHAAVSVYTATEAEEMLKYPVFDAIQLPLNIMDQRMNQVVKRLKDAGKAVFVRSVFLQGLFFMDPDSLTGNIADAKPYLQKLNQLAGEEGISIAQLAMRYVMWTPGVASLVIGAETPEQVRENAAMVSLPDISPACRAEAEKAFAQVPVHVLNPGMWTK